MKKTIFIMLGSLTVLSSLPTMASDNATLSISGELTNYNKCTFDNKENNFKCGKKTAYRVKKAVVKLKKAGETAIKKDVNISTLHIY